MTTPAEAPRLEPEPVAPPVPAPAVTAPVAPPVVRPRPAGQAGLGDSRDARDDRLAAERRLLEIARTALGRGRTDGALATLHQHARLFPSGQLAEERESLLVQALVAKGDYAQARERATRFHRQHPHSLFAPVVEQALQSIP
jgi:TolA-binding protein